MIEYLGCVGRFLLLVMFIGILSVLLLPILKLGLALLLIGAVVMGGYIGIRLVIMCIAELFK